jgi:protein phosphatase
VGDSRAYLLRGSKLRPLTRDHTLVSELARAGGLTRAFDSERAHRHVVTRALGIESEVEIDMTELRLRVGDAILLCTDGLYGAVSHQEIGAVLRRVRDSHAAVELVQTANAAGGPDNVSAVVVRLEDSDATLRARAIVLARTGVRLLSAVITAPRRLIKFS